MAKTSSFAAKVAADFPEVRMVRSDDFSWSPVEATVYAPPLRTATDRLTLLHEVAHALLDHRHFARDIELLKLERQAWEYVAERLAPLYGLELDEGLVEDSIDTYREWLHARSTCPSCSQTGLQTGSRTYRCLGCDRTWRVNDARRCALRRYSLKT